MNVAHRYGEKLAMGKLLDRLGTSVGSAIGSGLGAVTEKSTENIPKVTHDVVEGLVNAFKPHAVDAANALRGAGTQALQAGKQLAMNPRAQMGAAGAAGLYGAKKLYDAYQEHKLRSMAGNFMANQHPEFNQANEMGRMLAARRMGMYRT